MNEPKNVVNPAEISPKQNKPLFIIGFCRFLEKSLNFSNGLRPIPIFSKVLDCSQNTLLNPQFYETLLNDLTLSSLICLC